MPHNKPHPLAAIFYMEGAMAYREGVVIEVNPYRELDVEGAFAAWRDGWIEAANGEGPMAAI